MSTLANKHIIIAEDEAVTLRFLASFLHKQGYRISKAATGKETLDHIVSCHKKRDHVDLVLADVNLPDRTGWSVMDELKEKGIELPFLFMTGDISRKTKLEFEKRGITHYLLKAFTHQELTEAIDKVLRPPKAHGHHHSG